MDSRRAQRDAFRCGPGIDQRSWEFSIRLPPPFSFLILSSRILDEWKSNGPRRGRRFRVVLFAAGLEEMRREPEESRNIVFILGAGASAAYGPPVMAGFMDEAKRLYFAKKSVDESDGLLRCYEKLFSFHDHCRTSTWAFRRNWENMEELYTQADLLRLSSVAASERDKYHELCSNIAWVIWDVYRRCTVQAFSERFPQVCHRVVDGDFRPIVITTNYDLLCELALTHHTRPKEIGGFAYPGFIDKPGGGRFLSTDMAVGLEGFRRNVVPIIKLHGSTNWFVKSRKPEVEWVAAKDGLVGMSEATGTIPSFTGMSNSDVTPGIIPPMLGKMSVAPVIAAHWSAAIHAIRYARQIWVIGYSFPQTDVFMTRLLTQGLLKDFQLERFVIADLQSEEKWQERIDSMLGFMLREHKFWFVQGQAGKVLAQLNRPLTNWHPENMKNVR